jgi:outer membrane protein assembly factor BamB
MDKLYTLRKMIARLYLKSALALVVSALFVYGSYIYTRPIEHSRAAVNSTTQATYTDWPMYMGDPQHTGSTPASFNFDLAKVTSPSCLLNGNFDANPCILPRWKKQYSEWPNGMAQIVVSGGILILANMDGKLYAYDAETGASKWTFDSGAAIAVTPAVYNGKIYFGNFAGRIYGLNLSDMSQAFTPIQTGGPIYSSPVVFIENSITKVFSGSNDGKMYGINGDSGSLLFAPFDTGSIIYSNPAYYNGNVFFASENMYVYAISSTTGLESWKFKLQGESNRGNHPVIATESNTVLFHSVPRFGNTGMGLKDRYEIYGIVGFNGATPKPLAQILYDYQTQVQASPATKSMYLFDINTGSEITSFSASGTPLSMIPLNLWYMNGQIQPLVMNNREFLFGAFSGYVRLDSVTREFSTVLKYLPVRGDEYTGGTIANGELYGGFEANLVKVPVLNQYDLPSNASRIQMHGCLDCADVYAAFDPKTNTPHWGGYTGDGYTNYGSFITVANNRLYYSSRGYLYAF